MNYSQNLFPRRSFDLLTERSVQKGRMRNLNGPYDLNAKVNFTLSDKDRLYLSGYFGRDIFNFGNDFASDWGNATGSLRWDHLFSDRLFSNFTAVVSDYNYAFGVPEGAGAFDWNARINNYLLKGDFSYFLSPKSQLDFGGEANFYRFHPGRAAGRHRHRPDQRHAARRRPAGVDRADGRHDPRLACGVGPVAGRRALVGSAPVDRRPRGARRLGGVHDGVHRLRGVGPLAAHASQAQATPADGLTNRLVDVAI